jgi:hypothetical protein
MKRFIKILALAIVAVTIPYNSYAQESSPKYIISNAIDGHLTMEESWVVSKNMILSWPDAMDSYNSINDGIYIGESSVVKFLAKNRYSGLKVYLSDDDLEVSLDIPSIISDAYKGFMSAVNQAGGMERFIDSVNGDPREKRLEMYMQAAKSVSI